MRKEALTIEGAQLWPLLSKFDEFYLAGGTALALQIGHRVSVDFDFFSNKEIPRELLVRVRKIFSDYTVVPNVNNRDELTVFVGSVKVTFLYYPFPLIRPLASLEGIQTASIQEIAAMKAYTIGRRTSLKDYIDMHALIVLRHVDIRQVIDLALEKYKTEFNDRLFLEQLVSVDEADDENIRFLGETIDRSMLEKFFEEQVKSIKL